MHCQIASQEDRIEKEIGELDRRLATYVGKDGRNAMHARAYIRVLLRFKREQLGSLRFNVAGQTAH